MLDLTIKLQIIGQIDDSSINSGADVALLEQVFEEVLELAFLATDDGSEHLAADAGHGGEESADDLFPGLGRDGDVALGAIALADAGIEDTEEVVDLGDGADS